MRRLFAGYYRPTSEEFSTMWKECIFVFDTNVLLHVYRYTPQTAQRLLDILKLLQDRIWIPYQVAQEFHEQRIDVIRSQFKVYTDVEKILDSSIKSLMEIVAQQQRRHPSINEIEHLVKSIDKSVQKAKKSLRDIGNSHPDRLTHDDLLETVADLFDGKVGNPYSKEQLKETYAQADIRFKEGIAPGFKDAKKNTDEQYGDVVLWFQIIDHARIEKKPVIFVTDDRKEDWWVLGDNKRILGPRPELIHEIADKAHVSFYMYRPDQFMEYAEVFLELQAAPQAIEEVREISQEDEIDQTATTNSAAYSGTHNFDLSKVSAGTRAMNNVDPALLAKVADQLHAIGTNSLQNYANNFDLTKGVIAALEASTRVTPALDFDLTKGVIAALEASTRVTPTLDFDLTKGAMAALEASTRAFNYDPGRAFREVGEMLTSAHLGSPYLSSGDDTSGSNNQIEDSRSNTERSQESRTVEPVSDSSPE